MKRRLKITVTKIRRTGVPPVTLSPEWPTQNVVDVIKRLTAESLEPGNCEQSAPEPSLVGRGKLIGEIKQ